jgi:endonuclease/exonuclease/phosphatase family metal-dependent hydrolase
MLGLAGDHEGAIKLAEEALRELAELTEMYHVFGSNLEFQGGDYGNAILSRWPIVEHKNHALPSLDEGEPP